MKLLNITETATLLRATPAQVRRLIKTDKDFPCLAYGKKSFRIIAEKLDGWILQQTKNKDLPAKA